MMHLLSSFLLLACSHPPVVVVAPVAVVGAGPVEVAVAPVVDAAEAPALTPAALYERCRDRVEGPESEGECTADTDCAKAGCSSEVCTSSARAPEVMTTCEVLPCFGTLQACGCHEGRCTWTLSEVLPGLPLPRIPIKVPPRGD